MKIIIAFLLIILFIIAAYLALSGSENAILFSVITALVAFGFSLFNFYYQHFRSIHDLKCTLVAIGYDGKSFVAHYTFENMGTHQEIILGGTFVFPDDQPEKSYTYSTLVRSNNHHNFMPEIMSPFIIAPKEIALKRFEWYITYKELLSHFKSMKGENFRQNQSVHLLSFKVDFVNPSTRTKASKLIKCSDIMFHDDFISCQKPHKLQNNLFNEKLQIF